MLSSKPCVRVRGRREEEERGVETPVCGPVPEVPYMLGIQGRESQWRKYVMDPAASVSYHRCLLKEAMGICSLQAALCFRGFTFLEVSRVVNQMRPLSIPMVWGNLGKLFRKCSIDA